MTSEGESSSVSITSSTAVDNGAISKVTDFWIKKAVVVPIGALGYFLYVDYSVSKVALGTVGTVLTTVGASGAWIWWEESTSRIRDRLALASVLLLVVGSLMMLGAFLISEPSERITVKVGQSPQDVALGERYAWISDPEGENLVRFDLGERDLEYFRLASVFEVVVSGRDVFASTVDGRIVHLDESGRVKREVTLSSSAGCLAILDGEIWATLPQSESIASVDLLSLETTELEVGGTPASIAASDGTVWVTDVAANEVVEIDAASDEVMARYPTGTTPVGVWADGGSAWVGSATSNLVTVIRPDRTSLNIRVPERPSDLEVADGVLWIVSFDAAKLTAISVQSGELLGIAELGERPLKLDVGPDYVWITEQGSGSLTGILRSAVTK